MGRADPLLLLPLQPTCTSARRCGRAAGCASRPTRASSAAGACQRDAARCGSTAWPMRAAGCTPAAGTAAAPTPRSPRYVGMEEMGDGLGGGWGWGSPVAHHSSQIYSMFRTEHLLSPLQFPRLKSSLHHSRDLGFLACLRNSHRSSCTWMEHPRKATALGCSSCRHVCIDSSSSPFPDSFYDLCLIRLCILKFTCLSGRAPSTRGGTGGYFCWIPSVYPHWPSLNGVNYWSLNAGSDLFGFQCLI